MTDDYLIIDTPEQIEAFRLTTIVHGLRLEIKMQAKGWPVSGLPTRGMALQAARRTLQQYGSQDAPQRTRKQCLAAMQTLVQQLGPSKEN